MPNKTHRQKTSRGRKRARKTSKRSVLVEQSDMLQTQMAQLEPARTRRVHGAKLDALLLLSTERHQTALTGRMSKGIPRSVKSAATSSLTQLLAPRSGASAAVQVLAAQLERDERKRLLEEDLVSVLVDVSEHAPLEKMAAEWNQKSQQITPSTALLCVPRSRLRDLASLATVRYVEASVKLKPHCDRAHLSTGVVRAGVRTVPQRGRGVLIGIVDTGIDTSHTAFKTSSGTRIVNYFDQEGNAEHTAAQINAGNGAASPDNVGHGTHVAGIAAGNGGGSNGTLYEGVAPEADLAIVKTTFNSALIAQGIQHIFKLATDRKQPCVINLSLGGHYGGHDGTTVVERVIDQLSGPGRIVVVSAGNEGRDLIHASTVMPRGSATPARWVANLSLKAREVEGRQAGLLLVQTWWQREDNIRVRLRAPNGEIFEPAEQGEMEVDRSVFVVQSSHQIAAYSGDHVTTFVIIADPRAQWLSGWSIIAEEQRPDGSAGVAVGALHAWIADGDMGAFTTGYSQDYLVGMPGTAFSAITVGSYATRHEWRSMDPAMPNVDLDAVHEEDISYFTSPGPGRDGDNKPEIAAPGQWLISTLSKTASEDEIPQWCRLPGVPYAALQGTSMAAPYVTGALALLLEKDKTIDWAEAKRRLIKSTRQDGLTQTCWNSRWGYGKLDVERLLTIEPGV